MTHCPRLRIYNHQKVIPVTKGLMQRMEQAAQSSLASVLELTTREDAPICKLEEIEISLIDDGTIADVHLQFMSIPGATDVITFDHGEIHISVETARRQAEEYFQPFESELMLYVFHGLLHLAGHEDASEKGQATMDMHQARLLKEWWE